MSLFNAEEAYAQGKVVIGRHCVDLADMQLDQGRHADWGLDADEEYLSRVRIRAQDAAREILAQAMVEADRIKTRAKDEGYREGLAQSESRLQDVLEQTSSQCAAVISSIRDQGQSIWRSYRDDLVTLLGIMVEKTIAVELEARRRESLAGLLDQAVDMIEAQRKMVVSVHPRDRELVEELLQRARTSDAQQESWKVREDPQIEPGGLILECDLGRVDNTIASRQAGLQEIVNQLSLEEQD